MWNKFIASLAVVSLFATSTTFALDANPDVRTQNTIISSGNSVVISDTILDNTNGESIAASIDLYKDAKVWAILHGNNKDYVVFGSQNDPFIADINDRDNTLNFRVYGTVNNTRDGIDLMEGQYTLKVFANSGQVTEMATAVITIENNTINQNAPQIRDFQVTPGTFAPRSGEATTIGFDLTRDAFVTVEIIDPVTNNVVKTFQDFRGRRSSFKTVNDNLSVIWTGKNNNEQFVNEGNYRVVVSVENNEGTNVYRSNVRVISRNINTQGVIEDVEIKPAHSWDPAREELEIEIDLETNVRRLLIRFEKGNEIIEIADDEYVDERDYVIHFDGMDDDGDFIREGVWNLVIWADADRVSVPVTVKYQEQEIIEAFVSKDEFDPSEKEYVDLVIKSGVNSNITVELYDGNTRELTLVREESIRKNRFYSFRWDGTDRDGDRVRFNGNWRFKITAENQADDDIFAVEYVDINVREDEVSDRKTNITNDYVKPVVFDDEIMKNVKINFCIDEDDALISMEIFKNFSASGSNEARLLNEVSFDTGCHVIEWNGRDENNKSLKNGVYTYKITSKSTKGGRETEIGRFAIGSVGEIDDDSVPVPTPTPTPKPPIDPNNNCGNYWDTGSLDAETCDAIVWVTKKGIFNGHPDGSFRPYDTINRAETLKVVLIGMGAQILGTDGTNAGFVDVNPYDWYMPYVRTAKSAGFIEGYQTPSGRQAKLTNPITRVEFLKFTLEAAARYQGLNIPNANYSPYSDVNVNNPSHQWFLKYVSIAYNYYLFDEHYNSQTGGYALGINDLVQRREVALVLYRMYQAGLIN